MRARAAVAIALVAVASVSCRSEGPEQRRGELDERAQTDLAFAKVAMGILSDAAQAELRYLEETGTFTDDAEAAGLPTQGVGEAEADPVVCEDGRVLVLGEVTPHGAPYSLKLDATSDRVVASHYGEIAACDASAGPDAWFNGCRFAVDEGLVCPEEDGG